MPMLRLGISSFFFHTIRIKAEVPLFDLIEQPKVISEWTNDNDFDGSIILAGASYPVVNSLVRFIYGEEVQEDKELKNEMTKWLDVLKVSSTWIK